MSTDLPLDIIAQNIREAITTTAKQVQQLKDLTAPISPENAIGRVSRMDAINNKSVNDAALHKAKHKLEGLKRALDRIPESDFGQCARCKNQIPLGRILLVPHSRFCVRCA